MRGILFVVSVALALASVPNALPAQALPSGPYFGQTPPGFTPQIFAPGSVSLPNRYEYCLVFSPGMDECVFGLTNGSWSGFTLLYTRMAPDGTWSDPVTAPFQGTGDAVYPTFSMDGTVICFASSRPAYPPVRIWRAQREDTGFSQPVALDPPVFSGYDEWGSSFTSDGVFYFCSDRPGGLGSGDIYRAVTSPDGTVTVENLGAPINSPQLEGAPRIAPDESYLIFESQRPGGYGQSDLYISYRQGGAWTTPRNLGESINTAQIEDGPFVSPDGRYLFFNRRRSPYTGEQSEIWWVDARAAFDPGQTGMSDADTRKCGSSLLRIEPNPFAASATLTYSTPVPGFVSIKVYDVLGRQIGSLVNALRDAGTYTEDLPIPGGASDQRIYLCQLRVDERRLATVKATSSR